METRTGSSSSGKSRNGHSGRGRDFLDGQDFALSGLSNGLRGLSENGCRRQESEDKELANGQRNGSNQNCSQDNSIDGSGTKMTGSGCGLNVVVEEVPYIVRRMKESEIPLVLQLCKREGRQMGRSYELISWFRFDPQGFFVAVSPQSGN